MFLFDVTANKFMKGYGAHRSALTYFFTRCEVTPTSAFLQKMKQGMSGQEALLVRERNHFHLKSTLQYAGGYLKPVIQQVCSVYVSLS
jgi:hypothetical protein